VTAKAREKTKSGFDDDQKGDSMRKSTASFFRYRLFLSLRFSHGHTLIFCVDAHIHSAHGHFLLVFLACLEGHWAMGWVIDRAVGFNYLFSHHNNYHSFLISVSFSSSLFCFLLTHCWVG
jgi:hypothetical protein